MHGRPLRLREGVSHERLVTRRWRCLRRQRATPAFQAAVAGEEHSQLAAEHPDPYAEESATGAIISRIAQARMTKSGIGEAGRKSLSYANPIRTRTEQTALRLPPRAPLSSRYSMVGPHVAAWPLGGHARRADRPRPRKLAGCYPPFATRHKCRRAALQFNQKGFL